MSFPSRLIPKMDPNQMARLGRRSLDFVCDYWRYLAEQNNYSELFACSSSLIFENIPGCPPSDPVEFEIVLDNFRKFILPQIHHWQSPLYFAYFPANTSIASVVAETLIAGLGGVSFGRPSNPGFVDLELKMVDWLGQAIGLPRSFMKNGGGALHLAASESTLMAFVLARKRRERPLRFGRFVVFASELAHCSVEKTCLLMEIEFRPVRFSENSFRMTGRELEQEINGCLREGKVPLLVVATLGTTSVCSSDDLWSIGEVCGSRGIWLHVDAAYAGAALVCPELRRDFAAEAIAEKVDSFAFNLHRFESADSRGGVLLNYPNPKISALQNVRLPQTPSYLETDSSSSNGNETCPSQRDWYIFFGRRFRALAVYFLFEIEGIEGIREHVRRQIRLARYFEDKLTRAGDYEIVGEKSNLGLVCFRARGSNQRNRRILDALNRSGVVFMKGASVRESFFLRFVISSPLTKREHVDIAFSEVEKARNLQDDDGK